MIRQVILKNIIVSISSVLFQAYLEMPPVTRVYTTACVITTLAVQLEIVSPFQLYFNPLLILRFCHIKSFLNMDIYLISGSIRFGGL